MRRVKPKTPAIAADSDVTVPVLICPILNRRDLLDRMLDTIDVRVQKLVLIDNSPDGSATDGLDGVGRTILRLHHNIGVGSAWNLGIRVTPLEPWWLIVNNDVVFMRGDLERLAKAVTANEVVWLPDMRTFAVTPVAMERVGWFDECFVPGYFEDNDFAHRCILAGVHIETLRPSGDPVLGSNTIRSDKRLAKENNRTFPLNRSYYLDKWGGAPDHEVYRTPFDSGGDFRAWRLSMDRLRDLTWQP